MLRRAQTKATRQEHRRSGKKKGKDWTCRRAPSLSPHWRGARAAGEVQRARRRLFPKHSALAPNGWGATRNLTSLVPRAGGHGHGHRGGSARERTEQNRTEQGARERRKENRRELDRTRGEATGSSSGEWERGTGGVPALHCPCTSARVAALPPWRWARRGVGCRLHAAAQFSYCRRRRGIPERSAARYATRIYIWRLRCIDGEKSVSGRSPRAAPGELRSVAFAWGPRADVLGQEILAEGVHRGRFLVWTGGVRERDE